MRRLVAILLGAAISSAAFAADEGQGYGLGMHSCAEFADAYKAQPAFTEDLYFTWAQGFMSGLNLASIAGKLQFRVLNGVSMESQKTQIRSYCEEHPQGQYASAVIALYNDLPGAPANSN